MSNIESALDNHSKSCIDGKYRDSAKIVGYCWCAVHKGYLTVPLLRRHNCLGKQCRFLQRFNSVSFWVQRAKMKAKRKEQKEDLRFMEKQQQTEIDT